MDSSGYLALINPRDIYHQQVVEAASRIARQQWRTYTTNYVIAEAHALFLARLGYQHASAFLRQFERSSAVIVRVGTADDQQAREIIYSYSDKRFSLTDATSGVVMERYRVGVALISDHNFLQYGFAALWL